MLIICFFFISCDFNIFQSVDDTWDGTVYTIPELFDNDLAEDGETYLIEGYIYEYNYSLEYEDFFLFPEKIYDRESPISRMDVTVVKNLNSIFTKIIEAFENTDSHWIKVTIRAEAKEITIYGNGWSSEIFVLETDALRVDN